MKENRHRKLLYIAVLSLLLLGGVLFFVSPDEEKMAYILAPIFLSWLSLSSFGVYMIGRFTSLSSRMGSLIVYSTSSILVLLVLLSGVGQLTLRDVLLVLSLVLVMVFYLHRSWG